MFACFSISGRVQIRSKTTADTPCWSQPFYIFKNHPSGLDLRDLQSTMSVVKRHTPLELDAIEKGIKSCFPRMSPDEQAAVKADFERIKNPRSCYFHWQDGGKFKRQIINAMAEEDREEVIRLNRISTIQNSWHRMTAVREERQRRGVNLVIGDFVAVHQKDATGDQPRFWIGKVMSIMPADMTLSVRWYNSPSEFGKYKCWTGRKQIQTVATSDVLASFQHMAYNGNRIPRAIQKDILRCLETEVMFICFFVLFLFCFVLFCFSFFLFFFFFFFIYLFIYFCVVCFFFFFFFVLS